MRYSYAGMLTLGCVPDAHAGSLISIGIFTKPLSPSTFSHAPWGCRGDEMGVLTQISEQIRSTREDCLSQTDVFQPLRELALIYGNRARINVQGSTREDG